jgi:acyl phosphate:glycerol-3-phosphate acyltransferase
MLVVLTAAAIIGYLLGALPFGYLVARAHGVDIFTAGSGNPGATNVKRVLGARAGNLVFLLDALKGAVAAGWPDMLCLMVGANGGSPLADFAATCALHLRAMRAVGMFAAVLGHSFSVFTSFKGGKGVATASGGLLILMPVQILIGAATWVITFLASRYVSLGSIFGAMAVPVSAWAFGLPLLLNLAATALALLVIVRHWSNIRRLLAGTEHRWERRSRADGESPS